MLKMLIESQIIPGVLALALLASAVVLIITGNDVPVELWDALKIVIGALFGAGTLTTYKAAKESSTPPNQS